VAQTTEKLWRSANREIMAAKSKLAQKWGYLFMQCF